MNRVVEDDILSCPICASADAKAMQVEHPEVILYRCSKCRHRWSVPRPGEEPEPYDAEYFLNMHRRWFENPDLNLFRKIASIRNELSSDSSVLDLGCGNGALLNYLDANTDTQRLVGVDIIENKASGNVTFVQQTIEHLDLQEKFDLVVSLAVIEHVADIEEFMQTLTRHCKPSGRVVIMTVNDDSLIYYIARHLRSTGISSAAFDRLYSKHHIHHFSRNSLTELCRGAGLKVEQTWAHNSPLAATDVPDHGPIWVQLYRVALAGIFLASRFIKGGVLQTVTCRKT